MGGCNPLKRWTQGQRQGLGQQQEDMDRDRRMENGNGQRNRKRNIGQVQVQDQGEVYIQREMDRKTGGDRGKNILGTWKGTGEQEQRGRNRRNVTQTGINREIGTGTVTGIEGHE